MTITIKNLKKIYASQLRLGETVHTKLTEEPKFTGKIIFTVHCKDGGIGSTDAAIQRDVKETVQR